jgi:putative ABC transport system ATP-binding protein
MGAPAPVIRLTNVAKEYRMGQVRVPALRRVSLEFTSGEMVAIVGQSGSGKSTLMNLIGCLDTPSEGRYLLDGVPVDTLNDTQLARVRNQKIGFVFQSFNLLSRISAQQNVELPLLYGNGGQRRVRARAALDRVGLSQRTRHLPTEMSGGEQQRVSIARALVTQPRIILADEPTGNLDTATSHEIMALLQELNQADGVLVLIVTHEAEIADHCGRIITLRDGQVMSDEPVMERLWAITGPLHNGSAPR